MKLLLQRSYVCSRRGRVWGDSCAEGSRAGVRPEVEHEIDGETFGRTAVETNLSHLVMLRRTDEGRYTLGVDV